MKITTKYNIDQMVWVMNDNKAQELKIQGIEVYVSGIIPSITYIFLSEDHELPFGDDKPRRFNEELVFKSKQELIKSL